MSRLSEREISRRLREPLDAEPPEGLLDRIKAEIPPVLEVGTHIKGINPPGGEVKPFPLPAATPEPRRQRWLIAASLAVMVLGGLLALQLQFFPVYREEGEAEEAVESVPEPQSGEDLAFQPEPPPPAAPAAPQAAAPRAGDPWAVLRESPGVAADRIDVGGNESGRQGVERGVVGGVEGGVAEGESRWSKDGVVISDMAALEASPGKQAMERFEDTNQPAAPVEVPGSFAEEVTVVAESPALEDRRISVGSTVAEGGVAGGVANGTRGEAPMRYGAKKGTTGGDAEPNDEAYGDTFFRSAGVNPFVDTDEDRLSTFGLDVDTASYTVTRRYLGDGNLPVPESVRVEEFVNFFPYGDEPPARDDFAIHAEGAPTPFAPAGYRLLRFNVRGREIRPEERKAAVLTFVVDVSGSMEQENRLGLVKSSLGLLLDRLRPSDKVGLVVYGSEARVVLEPTHDLARVRAAVNALRTDGATNAEAGLLLGYDVANRYFRPEGNNRILLCSDGVANVGSTGPQSILERIGKEARKGIELTTLGFGMGNYNDVLMEQLANKGDGRYAYLDTLEEARRVLVEELEGTLETIAKDAKVQVAFSPEVVERWRLLGYENRDIADEKFRDDTVDAGEIGAGHSVTALYEVRMRPGAQPYKPLAEIRLRWRSEQTGRVREETKLFRVGQLAPSWERATPSLRLAAVAAEFAEILRGSYWARGSSLDELFNLAKAVSAEQSESRRAGDVSELAGLIRKAAQLKKEK